MLHTKQYTLTHVQLQNIFIRCMRVEVQVLDIYIYIKEVHDLICDDWVV